MNLQLDAVQFDHEPSSATCNALTIRWDANRDVVRPEWRRSACVGPEDSPAAYAIAETKANTVTIKARFRKVVPDLTAVEIRAVDPVLRKQSWLAHWLRSCGILRLTPGNPLGEISPRRVPFGSDGLSGLETFELSGTRFEEMGVGVWTTIWQWQYRQERGPWIDFDRSEHRIFTLLEVPKEPWTQEVPTPVDLVLPRVDALEYACRWAQGSRTRTEAAAGITCGIFRAGPDILRYDRPGSGGQSYVGFALTRFLERLRGGEGNGPYVNCQDCASAVTAFANLIGCELWSAPVTDGDVFVNRPIAINPIIMIGDRDWGFPFPNLGDVFLFHQVAIDGEGTADDRVFDACLMVDGDEDPTKSSIPRTPLLPTGLPFVKPTGLAYRERFASPAGRGCLPQSDWLLRWPISEPNVSRPEPEQTPVNLQSTRLADWSGSRSAGADILFWPFDMTGSEFTGWRVVRADRAFEGGGVPHVQFLMASEVDGVSTRLRIETWQLPSRVQAHEQLARLLGRLEGGTPTRLDPPPLGDVAFANSDRYFMAFARGNLVVSVRNAGIHLSAVEDVASALDGWLVYQPEPLSDQDVQHRPQSNVLEATDQPIGVKYFADEGELCIMDGKPTLQKAAAGSHVVRVATSPFGEQTAEVLMLD